MEHRIKHNGKRNRRSMARVSSVSHTDIPECTEIQLWDRLQCSVSASALTFRRPVRCMPISTSFLASQSCVDQGLGGPGSYYPV